MPNLKGNNKQAIQDRRDWEVARFEIEAILIEAEDLPEILDLLKQRYDRPPDLLENAIERAKKIQQAARIARIKLDQQEDE